MIPQPVSYQITGGSYQTLDVTLSPGETIIAEAGAMLYMEDGISFETIMGDGSNPRASFFDKLVNAGSRLITGESLFLTQFANQGRDKKQLEKVNKLRNLLHLNEILQ